MNIALKILKWLCLRPWEALHVAGLIGWAKAVAVQRGGCVRVLCRDGGIGDVLWAAAAARIAVKARPQDVVLLLTRREMAAAVRLAAPELVMMFSHLPSPLLLAILRRLVQVMVLNYEGGDLAGRHLFHTYLEQLGCPQAPAPHRWQFTQAPDVRAAVPLACVYFGPSWAVRELPPQRIDELVLRLRGDLGLRVLQILPDQQAMPQSKHCDGWVIGESLPALCNLFDQCAVVITIDSVMLHLAVGTNARVVGLFGPTLTSARLFETITHQSVASGLECAGCHHRLPRFHWQSGCPFNIACMKQLTTDHIIDVVRQILAT